MKIKTQVLEQFSAPIYKIILLALTVAVAFLYVIQINVAATKGYEIRELEKQISQLNKDTDHLQLQVLELESMNRVATQLKDTKLVKANPDKYIQVGAAVVASR